MRSHSVVRSLSVGLVLALLLFVSVHRAQPQEEPKLQVALMHSVGALSAAFLRQTNMIVGLICDSKAKGVYDDATANQVLEQAIETCTAVDKQWETLHGSGLAKEEMDFLSQMGSVGDLIKKEGLELKAFWDTKDEAHAKAYEAARAQANEWIDKELGGK